MKTLKRIFELMCSGTVVAAEHLCQCAKCSCNFDKTKAKNTDAGCECPNCGTLLDEKGAAKVEDQAGKEIKAEDEGGDMDAQNATRQPALEAGGPGSGPRKSGVSEKATAATAKAEKENTVQSHIEAHKAHDTAQRHHDAEGSYESRVGNKDAAKEHWNQSDAHGAAMGGHAKSMDTLAKTPEQKQQVSNYVRAYMTRDDSIHKQSQGSYKGGGFDSASAIGAASLQASFNGNQHKSAKELAAEHSVAADTASKVAASASKAARGQDPSNKEGLHDSAITMHTAAKSLHELAAAKHRSAGNEDCAKDHDTAAAGHGDEIQAHKGVIEACGGMAARGNGAAGLEASNPEGHNQYTEANEITLAKANELSKTVGKPAPYRGYRHDLGNGKAVVAHPNGKFYHIDTEKKEPASASNATPAAGLQLDCSACVEAKAAKTILNPIADGIIQYMPAGTHTITPSQNGRPVTVSVAVDASAADKLEQQRRSLEASGKKPFFSVQHSTQIAAFWPAEFFWDTRLDATGSLVEGVWARGEWTRAGREAVEGKDFRTFSPTFFVDAIRNDPNRPVQVVCNDEAKANMGALENDPAFQTISPLWAHDASAPGTPKPKPEGVTTEKLIVMVHDELRASNPDLQDVVNAMAFKYDMRVNANDVARALRGEALEAGGPGSGPHKGEGSFIVVKPNIEGGDVKRLDKKEYADYLSQRATEATSKAEDTKDVFDHAEAKSAHDSAAMGQRKWGSESAAKDHEEKSKYHWGKVTNHFDPK